MTDQYTSIYNYINVQEALYRLPIELAGKWRWGMREHLTTSYLYTNSQLITGKDDFTPVKNITRPILNLQHRTEDIDLKDVQIYVDDPDKYHLSFLVKKYHDDVFVVENDLDTFFDELNVSRIDYGGGLSKRLSQGREVVPLQSIAFCDQTDILSGAIGIKHFYSPDQLMDMEPKGWGNKENGATATLKETITLCREQKVEKQNDTISTTPSKYIEVYEVHGTFPIKFLDETDDSGKFSSQIHIVCFYNKSDGKKGNITLFKGEEKESPFKLIKRDPVYGRALGFGGAEELFEPQVWVNYAVARANDMLDSASKTIMITQDSTLSAKHPTGLKDLDNLEFIEEGVNGNTRQLDTFPRNINLFEKSIVDWEIHAKQMGASEDPLMGKEPVSGTPFASLQAQIQQGMGLHEYRRGQFAKHIEEIYYDDYLPQIIKEITKGTQFLSELSLDELQYVQDCVIRNESNKFIKDRVLAGKTVTQEEVEAYKEKTKLEFSRKGNKHFIEILKGEFKGIILGVKVNVAGKSKNLGQSVDKLSNMVRFVMSTYNPQTGSFSALDDPRTGKMVNDIWELSGFSPVDFSIKPKPPQLPQGQQTNQVSQYPQANQVPT